MAGLTPPLVPYCDGMSGTSQWLAKRALRLVAKQPKRERQWAIGVTAVGLEAVGLVSLGLVTAPAADANDCWNFNNHTVQTFASEFHLLVGGGSECEYSAGWEYWAHLSTREDANPWWPQICRYQGFIAELAPNGSVVRNSYSSYHGSCSFIQAWVNWDSYEGLYREDTGFRHKWKSAATGDAWVMIGDIRD